MCGSTRLAPPWLNPRVFELVNACLSVIGYRNRPRACTVGKSSPNSTRVDMHPNKNGESRA